MKATHLLLRAILSLVSVSGEVFAAEPPVPVPLPVTHFPDLMVTSFAYAGDMDPAAVCPFLTVPGTDCVIVGLNLGIRNQGKAPALPFGIGIHYATTREAVVRDDAAPALLELPLYGWENLTRWGFTRWIEYTLVPRRDFLVAVWAVLPPEIVRKTNTIFFQARVDTCAYREFSPDYCAVQESNEDNNRSDPISVDLSPVK
jgi:hypothetical protein